MKFEFRKPCKCGCGVKRTYAKIGSYSISFFKEFGEWFLYITTKTNQIRLSSAGCFITKFKLHI